MRLSYSPIEAIGQEAGHFFGAQAEVWLFGSRADDKQRGFTLVELIAVLIIVGILAAVAAPRFFNNNAFESRGFYDQVISTLRYAQKAAIAQNRNVCVAFTTSSITLNIAGTSGTGSSCDTDLVSPTGQAPVSNICPIGQTAPCHPYTVNAPKNSNVTLSGYNNTTPLYFDALGRPSVAESITVSGYATVITVEAETGYVH